MTKVQTRFTLAHLLDEKEMAAVAEAHGIYGIGRVKLDGDGTQAVVDYDASRLSLRDVETQLIAAGVPVLPRIA